MKYAIMRMSKLKTTQATARSLKHNFREIETPNADRQLTAANVHSATGTDEAIGKLRNRLKSLEKTPRKDAVVCVEYLMTASPDWFAEASKEQQEEFFNNSKAWLADKYGEDNIISFSIHKDETTPHISAHVVPITTDGRLSAKELIGNKKQMQDDQTSFAERHAAIGLERGVRDSKAEHQDIKDYYVSVNRAKERETNVNERFFKAIPEKKMLEKHEDYKKRIAENLNQEFKNLKQKASIASEIAITEAKTKKAMMETQKENATLKDDLKRYKSAIDLIRLGGLEEAQELLAKGIEKQKAIKEEKTRKFVKKRELKLVLT